MGVQKNNFSETDFFEHPKQLKNDELQLYALNLCLS